MQGEHLFTVEKARANTIPWLAIALFIATTVSVILIRPATMPYRHPDGFMALVWEQLPFALSLFPILLAHEFGHYFAARLHRYPASLPYFLPGIWPFGTFGALIVARHPFRDRSVLFDIAVAGPLAGFVVAIPVVWYGLSQSEWIQTSAGSGFILWDPLIMKALAALALQPAPGPEYDILLHPAAFGGWAGLFVTMLNLLPFGPLDGGKTAYALLGYNQRWVAYASWGLLCTTLLLDWFWILWLGLALVFRLPHPPTLNDTQPIGRTRVMIGLLVVLVFVLSFMPLPITFRS
jgi:membrane-associated protease RseP (regulator of RpoE activity)